VDLHVHLGDVRNEDVRIELYADSSFEHPESAVVAEPVDELIGVTNGHVYRAQLPGDRDPADFTVRVVPAHEAAFELFDGPPMRWMT
jgi:hypothetical protein